MLVVAALVLGLGGVGTPLISRSILKPDLAANFERALAPHVILRSADFGRLDLIALRARAGVQSAALRDFSVHRVEVRPDTWLPLYLYGVDDFEASPIGRLLPQRGTAIPPPGTVLVERDGLKVSTFTIGSAPPHAQVTRTTAPSTSSATAPPTWRSLPTSA